jgi:uncharacterized membrane protein YhaH (DUF805 family)
MSESTANHYAAPLAEVADIAPPTPLAELSFFSARGRIGRLRYLAYSTGASLIHSLVAAEGVRLAVGFGSPSLVVNVASLLALGALLWFVAITGIKRCHDIGISGWWTVTCFIPVIALAWIFWPGEREANRFGPPPPPNNWGVRLLGALLPLVFLVGMVAGIALPAYQGYVTKARAAQSAQSAGQR